MRRIIAILVPLAIAGCAAAPERAAPVADEAPPDVIVVVDDVVQPAPEPRRGLFALLRPRDEVEEVEDDARVTEALIKDGAEPIATANAGEILPSLTDDEIAARSVAAAPASTRPRLFGNLFQRTPGEIAPSPEPTPTEVMLAEQGDIQVEPSLTDEEIAARGAEERTAAGVSTRPRLFGGGRRAGDAAPTPQPTEFGRMTKACDVPKRALGEEVARSPGSGTYRLYDTKPYTAEPRVQYLTGFRDGCPRQFYAALALFGSPVIHETKRYDNSNTRAYSEADEAYERVKRQTCGVKRGTFCPEARLDRLGRDVALITAYPSFGGNTEWLDVVLFKGQVAGQAVEF